MASQPQELETWTSCDDSNFYSLASDSKCLWKIIMALILDRHYRITDAEISREFDQLNGQITSQGVQKLIVELGNLQRTVSENVQKLEDRKKTAKGTFIANHNLLKNGTRCELLPLVDDTMSMSALEELVAYYYNGSDGMCTFELSTNGTDSIDPTVSSTGNGADTAAAGHDCSINPDYGYVIGLLQPIERTTTCKVSNDATVTADVESTMYNHLPELIDVAPSVYKDPAAVSAGADLDVCWLEGMAGDANMISEDVEEMEGDANLWETVTRKKNKNKSHEPAEKTTTEQCRLLAGLPPTPMENGKFYGEEGAARRKTEMCKLFQEGKCNWSEKCNYAHSESELVKRPRQSKGMVAENSTLTANRPKATVLYEDPTPAGNIKFRGINGVLKRKTEICKNFQAGKCKWGEECNYAHSEDELKPDKQTTSIHTIQENPTPAGNIKFKGINGLLKRKTEICENFLAGKCKWGEECNYAHSVDELKHDSSVPSQTSTKQTIQLMEDPTPGGNKKFQGTHGKIRRKTEICKNFQMGRCGWGKQCNYAHSADELRDSVNPNHDEPCADQQCPGRLRYERRRTTMCAPEKGKCKLGSMCMYAHSGQELREMPKHEICERHAAGRCPALENCVYAHSTDELRPATPTADV